MLAEECKRRGMYWIHIGSGCIYNGYEKEFTEEDGPNFTGSFYSKTKAVSQWILEQDYRNLSILRIRMPVDDNISKRSYIAKVVKYAKAGYPIFDMQNSMTTLDDLAKVIHFMGDKRMIGTFNVVNHGTMSPIDVLKVYKELKEPDLKWKEATYDQVRKTIKADRSNCILSPKKLDRAGYWMPDIDKKIREFLS
jgi:dTDP-4-dehydrorhamnose reductase